jgi:hypothetical protein
LNTPEFSPGPYRHDLEVVRDTAEQVIRDFGVWGLEIRFSGNHDSAYDELLTQLIPVLGKLYAADPGAFMALLYRIDVDEGKVKKIGQTSNNQKFIIKLSELVLEREFMKVLTRKLFRHRNG